MSNEIVITFVNDINKKHPQWMSTMIFKDDVLYFPVEVFCINPLCMFYDGVPVINEKGHIFAPDYWIEQELRDEESKSVFRNELVRLREMAITERNKNVQQKEED